MNSLLRIGTALLLSLSVSSFAQQIVTTPGPRSTPEAADQSAPEATSSPQAVEKPAPKAVRVSKKETVAAPAPKESAAPAPARSDAEPVALPPQGKKAVESALKKMEDQWQAAIVAHDLAAVDALVAADFAGINPEGKFINKSAILAQMKNDKDTYGAAKNEKLNVHLYGPNIAVVTGSVRSKGKNKNGQSFDRAYRYTDTWVERDGKWQCVASQDSLLP
jgi:ketosteroid isomerase-like protein